MGCLWKSCCSWGLCRILRGVVCCPGGEVESCAVAACVSHAEMDHRGFAAVAHVPGRCDFNACADGSLVLWGTTRRTCATCSSLTCEPGSAWAHNHDTCPADCGEFTAALHWELLEIEGHLRQAKAQGSLLRCRGSNRRLGMSLEVSWLELRAPRRGCGAVVVPTAWHATLAHSTSCGALSLVPDTCQPLRQYTFCRYCPDLCYPGVPISKPMLHMAACYSLGSSWQGETAVD